MPSESRKRRLLKRWELIFLIIILLIFLYFGLQKLGISPVWEADETEVTDDPHPGY